MRAELVGEVTYQEALDAVRARLGAKGAGHSERVAQTAADLAVVYGVDVDRARLGGLLHDWDRDRAKSELLAAAADEGVVLSEADRAVPYLLHSRTGAHGLAERFPGLPADVVTAVSRHTVGAVGMTDLDMIVYLADMMEPARTFEGVDELRSSAGRLTLRELFALGYQQSLSHLVHARKRIHPDTVAVWNDLVSGDQR